MSVAGVLLLALTACEAPAVIGIEHRMTIATLATDPATGDLLQAGYRNTGTFDAAAADLWYGRATSTGTFIRPATSLDLAGGPDAVLAAARLDEGWILAGHTTSSTGVRSAWVRRLDDTESEVWTVELSKAGVQTGARAVAVAFDQSVVVGGVETQADGRDDGWLARIDPDGGVLWRASFTTDYQQQAKDSTVLAIGLIPPSVAQIYTVGQRARDGGLMAAGLNFSLDGALYDSGDLGMKGLAGGVFIDTLSQLTVCTGDDSGALHALTLDRALLSTRDLPLRLDGARLTLAGCAQTPQTLWVGGTAVHGDGSHAPYFARIDKATFTVTDARELPQDVPTTALTVEANAAGEAWLAGRNDGLLRRWMTKLP